jgi:hypothetical protein
MVRMHVQQFMRCVKTRTHQSVGLLELKRAMYSILDVHRHGEGIAGSINGSNQDRPTTS